MNDSENSTRSTLTDFKNLLKILNDKKFYFQLFFSVFFQFPSLFPNYFFLDFS